MKGAAGTLDAGAYETLAKPSQKVPVTYYSGVEPDLFDRIIAKWRHGDMTDPAPVVPAAATAE